MQESSTDWSSWLDHAKARRAAGVGDATIMLELVQRGASSGEAEGVVRTLGARFELDAADQESLAQQKRTARRMLLAGVAAVVTGVGLVVLFGPAVFATSGFALVSGGLIAVGLFLIGKNIGTT